ncbi:uncharacterized protein [Halyomorpha halys]|uniref:uncharacterized protein n=1 Tax=Halyomorpha halys TaxID=286706 RepID=UPI0006D4CEC8|nr:uncharacterized protein LOC106681538 [Halyomorpha halys]XP_014277372.1 uncharacterized protein LOC106681538 [Halyomorpha halys]XP_014277373.1 uncharacterized protein LOC106681538 [Halyomorpha halys]
MRSHGSKVIEVEQQWKPRRFRRNRKWRVGRRNMQALSTKIIKLLEDDELNGRNSPCSVVSFPLSLDNRIEDIDGNSEWIRTAHIKNSDVNEQDRRSPLFTGRMLSRNGFSDDIQGSRQALPYEVRCNANASRLSIRDRLEPLRTNMERPEFDIPPHLDSPGIDTHRHLESPNVNIQQRMEAPMDIRSREPIGVAVPAQQSAFRQNLPNEELPSHLHPRFIRDQYDEYNNDRSSRNWFSNPSQRPRCFRRSLYYPPGYSSSPNEDTVQRQRRWPWLKTSVEDSENSPDYTGHYMRRDYSVERFAARDAYLPSGQRHYEQSEYNRTQYFDHDGNYPRESRSEISLPNHEVKNYSDYRPESYDMNYNSRRDDGPFDWSFSQVESYGPSFSPRRFYSSRPLPYSSGSTHPPHSSVMDNPRFRSLMEESGRPSSNWEGSHGRNYHCSYQERISDEDFTDSEQLDCEVEESHQNPKKQVRQMWKNLEKERGILVFRDNASVTMTRECAEYVKKILLKKASDSNKFSEKWKPRFLRTGLVHRTGLYQIICKDHQTVTWTLKQEIPPFEGHGFKILKRPYDWDCGPVRISMWLATDPADPSEALQYLEVENPGICASNWRLVSVSTEFGWRRFIVDVGVESALYLETNGWTILYWNHLLPVTRLINASEQLFFNQLAGDNP